MLKKTEIRSIAPKIWDKTNINTIATKKRAIKWELHYTDDTQELYMYNGTENVQIPTLANSTQNLYNGTVTIDGKQITIVNGLITNIV